MKIETKYDVGNIVWLITGEGVLAFVTTAKILSVNFVQDNSNNQTGNITYRYALKMKHADYYNEEKPSSCNERFLFPTKQALIESL